MIVQSRIGAGERFVGGIMDPEVRIGKICGGRSPAGFLQEIENRQGRIERFDFVAHAQREVDQAARAGADVERIGIAGLSDEEVADELDAARLGAGRVAERAHDLAVAHEARVEVDVHDGKEAQNHVLQSDLSAGFGKADAVDHERLGKRNRLAGKVEAPEAERLVIERPAFSDVHAEVRVGNHDAVLGFAEFGNDRIGTELHGIETHMYVEQRRKIGVVEPCAVILLERIGLLRHIEQSVFGLRGGSVYEREKGKPCKHGDPEEGAALEAVCVGHRELL
ncbi:MAG: hypothetical protein BWY66_00146 [bacterium ADurb.Bin374]|nr:MAG: hypothetical protein BWY66_00146 [bacterium ADurb.Bin374]